MMRKVYVSSPKENSNQIPGEEKTIQENCRARHESEIQHGFEQCIWLGKKGKEMLDLHTKNILLTGMM